MPICKGDDKIIKIYYSSENQLPSGYQALEYIEATGTQYIDTGVVPTLDTRVDFKFKVTELLSNEYPVIGARTGTAAANRFFPFAFHRDVGQIINGRSSLGTSQVTFDVAVNSIYECSFRPNDNVSVINGVSYTLDKSTYVKDTDKNLYIFATSGYNEVLYSKGKIYYVAIYDKNVLIKYLVPCMNSSNEVGMYDVINGEFYSNSGTGSFNYQLLPEEYQEVEYLQCTTTQYIDTGIIPNNGTGFSLDFAVPSIVGDYIRFGTRVNASTDSRYTVGTYNNTALGMKTLYMGFDTLYSNAWQIYDDTFVNAKLNFYNNRRAIVNDDLDSAMTLGTMASVHTKSLYAFAFNGATTYTITEQKIKSLKITQGSQLVRSYVPCYRKSDGVAGLYDLVGKEFHTNDGTGEFIIGPDVNHGENIVSKVFYGSDLVFYYLPTEYKELYYIEANGTQWIDTGVLGEAYVTIDCQGTEITSTSQIVLGTYTTSPSYFAQYSSTGKWGISSQVYGALTDVDYTTRAKFEINFSKTNAYIKVNGTTYTYNAPQVFVDTETFALFRAKAAAATNYYYANARIFRVKFVQNNKIVRDMIPCYRKTDNVVGMYDVINGVFYENSGTGNFKPGYVPPEYQEVEYIESTGTQYINTNILATQDHKMNIDFSVDTIENNKVFRIFGTRNGANVAAFISGKNSLNDPMIYAQFDTVSPTVVQSIEATANSKINVQLSKDGFYINSTLSRTFANYNNFRSLNPIILFGAYNAQGTIDITTQNLRIYGAKLYENDVLIRDYIPCYRKSDNVIGFYDGVNGVFYTNDGTGTFRKGPNV